MSEQIYLRWANKDDLSEICHIFLLNGLNFELHDHFMSARHLKQEEYHIWLRQRLQMFWSLPGYRFVVVEQLAIPDASDKPEPKRQILGFAAWHATGKSNPLKWEQIDTTWARMLESNLLAMERWYHRFFVNTIVNNAGMKQMLGRLHSQEHNIEPSLHLQFLYVHPDWQKSSHRLGNRLLQWGLNIADEFHLPIIVIASLAGYPFYLKHGLVLYRQYRIDFDPTRAYDCPVVIYKPKGYTGP